MIKLALPELPLWKVVPKNIVLILDEIDQAKKTTRSAQDAATKIRKLSIVAEAYAFGLNEPCISVVFKGKWDYPNAIVNLGDEFEPLPWEW